MADGDWTVRKESFAASYVVFERAIDSALASRGRALSPTEPLFRRWSDLVQEFGGEFEGSLSTVLEVQSLLTKLVHGLDAGHTDDDIGERRLKIDRLSKKVAAYGFSVNVIDVIRDRYGSWVNENLDSVRIVHRADAVFLEVREVLKNAREETVRRIDLGFIGSRGEPLFSPYRTAQENADSFFDKLDLFSILMTGIGEDLFNKAGIERAVLVSGAKEGDCKGDFFSQDQAENSHVSAEKAKKAITLDYPKTPSEFKQIEDCARKLILERFPDARFQETGPADSPEIVFLTDDGSKMGLYLHVGRLSVPDFFVPETLSVMSLGFDKILYFLISIEEQRETCFNTVARMRGIVQVDSSVPWEIHGFVLNPDHPRGLLSLL